MPRRDIIVIGASAGGVEALRSVVRDLPPDLPAAVFVVLHMPPNGNSALPAILGRAGPLPVHHPSDGEAITCGRIYVAPPDHHLLIHRGYMRVERGPRENRQRPAVDPLFRTAARAYGSRVIGVVLSGTLDDGTAGLVAIKGRGGLAVVQDPADALFPGMPQSALTYVDVDHCSAVSEMGAVLERLAREPIPGNGPVPPSGGSDAMEMEAAMAELEPEALQEPERPGRSSGYSCPECHGVLWELQDGNLLRFRCRVGHAYSTESLEAEQRGAVESALWVALRSLEEKAALADRLTTRSRNHGHLAVVGRFEEQAREARRHAEVIRQLLLADGSLASRTHAPSGAASAGGGGGAAVAVG